MTLLFISDMHFCAKRQEKVALFSRLLQGPAKKAKALYILGDIFEAWAGDDDMSPPHAEVIKIMADYTNAGGQLFVMRGNRDFLLGKKFANDSGCHLLNDETLISVNQQPTLLMHGDALCTEDRKFQIFRHIVNNKLIQKIFMCIPYPQRKKIWHDTRKTLKDSAQQRSAYLIDVYQPTVEKVMKKHRASRLIHGHIHKQAIYNFNLGDQPAERIVLGDWIEGDNILVADEHGLTLLSVNEYIASNQ